MHQSKSSEPILFIVVEAGAWWPRDLDYRGLTEICVVVQQADEPAAALAGRLYDRLSRLEQSGARVAVAALVLNDRFSHVDLARRCTVARLLTSPLLPSQPSELVFCARHARLEWEAHVIALSQTLSEEVPSSIRVSLELGDWARPIVDASRRSGVFARVGVSTAFEQQAG